MNCSAEQYIIARNRMHLSSDFKILNMGLHCHAYTSIPLPILTRENYAEIIRKLYWTEVKTAAPGFLPDGLIVQTYNGRHVVQGGRLVKYQEGETNS